ncbi:MAG: TRAP transporter fused permease subunit [Chloroflexota bacterium]
MPDKSQEEIQALAEQEGRYRQYTGTAGRLIKAFAAGACLFCLAYISGALSYLVYFPPNQYNAIFMTAVLVLTFLLVPAGKGQRQAGLAWYDLLLILASLTGCVYIVINAPQLAYFTKLTATPLEVVLGTITLVTLMEAVRRTMGWAMVIVAALFLFYARFGYLIPGALKVYPNNWPTLFSDIYLSTNGIFGGITGIASGVIFAFIAFGIFFVAAGGGDFFLKLALALTGTLRGGPAKAAIVGSALFGMLSGSPSANVMVTGSVTIPLMKSVGYKPYYAGAIESVASSGGAITPPVMAGAVFVMAELVGLPYAKIATIAAIPALLYFLSLFFQVDLQAAKQGLRGLPPEQLPSLKSALKGGWELIVPLVVLCLLLFMLRYPAEIAATYTIGALVAISLFRKRHRINLKRFIDGLMESLQSIMGIACIIALSGLLLAVLTVTGVGPKLSSGIVTLFGGNMLFLLIAAAIACYIMGMGIAFVASYILVAALVAPALVRLGLPVLAAHFFIMYMTISTNFTPPFCPAAFVASSIAKAHPFRIGFQAMRLGIVCFLVPFIVVYNPALILIGGTREVVVAIFTAIIGVFGLSAGIEGYLLSRMSWLQRILFIAGGLAMAIPGMLTDIIGIGILALAILWQWASRRRAKALTSPNPA